MKNYSTFIFDLDGTLLNDAKEISEENIKWLNRAYKEKGIISIAINDSISQLEKDNLLVNLKDNENNIIDFDSNNSIKDIIIGIVITCLIVIFGITIIILIRCFCQKDRENRTHNSERNNIKSTENLKF